MVPSPIKIVSFNTYLIHKRFNQNRLTFPEKRASTIRRFLEGKDLVFCQEVWGSGLTELTKNISNYHAIPPHRSSWVIFDGLSKALTEIVNTFYLHLQKTGGLYDFSNPSMHCRYRKKRTFRKSRSKSLKGVETTLWVVPQWGKDKSLLVFNTHLDPWHAVNRRQQVYEILEFLGDTLKIIDDNSHGQHDWSQTGVLIVGDFNVKATSQEYNDLLISNQGWNDYFGEDVGHTYAGGNSLVCYPEDCGRIDYIFGIDRYEPPSSSSSYKFLAMTVVSRSIVTEPVGVESSDHYALVVDLVPTTATTSL